MVHPQYTSTVTYLMQTLHAQQARYLACMKDALDVVRTPRKGERVVIFFN